MDRSFDKGLFIWLFISFVIATIVGTLSHEAGHYIVARFNGYHSSIHYAYTNIDYRKRWIDSVNLAIPRESTDEYRSIVANLSRDSLWITIGGPLQTILSGTIGFILLFRSRRKNKNNERLSRGQWLLIFITLFWLRQAANMMVWLMDMVGPSESAHSDEIKLDKFANLPPGSILVATGLLGFCVLAIVLFKFIPRPQRLTFTIAGLIGGVAGYILWLYLLGPRLLP